MKTISLTAGLFLLGLSEASVGLSPDKNSDSPANPIFQEILNRVVDRDQDTDAILRVQAKDGCSHYPHQLSFSIIQARENDEVVVVLRCNNKVNDGVYEKYRLVIDNAIRAELSNQKKFQAKLSRIEEASRKERAKRFKQLTGGRLTQGMTQDEVKGILGNPSSVVPFQGARFVSVGSCDSWVYGSFQVRFHDGRAADITALRSQE